MICHLFLPLWCQAADSLSGAGLLRLFPFSRARTEGGTFIDNHMRWSEQGLLWGIDNGDHGHYSASWAQCLRTRLDSSLSLVLGRSSLYRISIMGVLSRWYHLFNQNLLAGVTADKFSFHAKYPFRVIGVIKACEAGCRIVVQHVGSVEAKIKKYRVQRINTSTRS